MFGASKFEKRLSEAEESLRRIEHAFKMLQVEWTETYDKFRQLHWRGAKRAKQLEADSSTTEESTRPVGGVDAPSSVTLSTRAMQVQQQILARRAKLPPRQNGGE